MYVGHCRTSVRFESHFLKIMNSLQGAIPWLTGKRDSPNLNAKVLRTLKRRTGTTHMGAHAVTYAIRQFLALCDHFPLSSPQSLWTSDLNDVRSHWKRRLLCITQMKSVSIGFWGLKESVQTGLIVMRLSWSAPDLFYSTPLTFL